MNIIFKMAHKANAKNTYNIIINNKNNSNNNTLATHVLGELSWALHWETHCRTPI